jgi:hypothetical protein
MSLASNPLTIVIIVLGALLLLLLGAYWLSSRRTPSAREQPAASGEPAWVTGLKSTVEEEIASPAAETIESLAQENLRKHPELSDIRIDFGTAPGGELEIWINAERYSSVEAIPDQRIRQAIEEAVDTFNQGKAGGKGE